LQQIRVEQKAEKQGKGEKQKNRVKARERHLEIRRRQIKKYKAQKRRIQPTQEQ